MKSSMQTNALSIGIIIWLGVWSSVEGIYSSNSNNNNNNNNGLFTFPDPHFGCDSSLVEQVQPFHQNVEHAINTVVSTAPQNGTFHATHHEQTGGVSVDVEANCASTTTRCSDCLHAVSDGLLHFCEARLVGVGRIPSNDGCSIRYEAYGSF
eukprot:Gb_29285 [translate_table: standard]